MGKMDNLIILENGTIYDPFKNKKKKGSILIEDGVVKEVGKVSAPDNARKIDCAGKLIVPGLIDIHAHFREPGREDKETLATGARAAFSGGFTRVCVMPNTDPPLDSPEAIRFIIEKSADLPVQILPIGAITIGQKGLELAEVGEMVKAGAVAISDDGLPVQNGQVLRNALEYVQKYDVPVINHAEDIYLRNDGVMNEGGLSTRLGLPGNPDISESVMVHRDLEIADYTGGRIHIPHVSTKRSIDLIRRYKKMGVNVTAEVTPHHIGLTEELLGEYDTHAKVAPPLRSELDRKALIKGLLDGTIDCIATDHAPHTIEEKEMDFIHSPCGMIGLESAFGLSHTVLVKAGASTEKVVQWFTKGPAGIMGWNIVSFQIGAPAEIAIIDSNQKWTFKESHIQSKSKNSPMVGMKFTGKVIGTISGKNTYGNLLD
ncbi:MAG TPA: dihydroorotase [Candidatus Marinimicrobia bacterium]|nr:dihydroorotase [Candidatus Neomarinimicrobiota bacterium]